eukprot:TRINITY_DN553_c0_g2_i5.p1 TRINITY_DN553_c0_g2~~TRINITY_DN553_c0_g2_i5.p1  ORF type:complete len:145 (-),score=21.27 TRINITY_DN553_c0_g2_i5:27-461(-)
MHISTVGVDFKVKPATVGGKTLKLQIWDTAGQERFRTITSNFFRGSHAILVVYDITNSDSYHNLGQWLEEIKKHAPPDTKLVLVGNKTDREDDRIINTADARLEAVVSTQSTGGQSRPQMPTLEVTVTAGNFKVEFRLSLCNFC